MATISSLRWWRLKAEALVLSGGGALCLRWPKRWEERPKRITFLWCPVSETAKASQLHQLPRSHLFNATVLGKHRGPCGDIWQKWNYGEKSLWRGGGRGHRSGYWAGNLFCEFLTMVDSCHYPVVNPPRVFTIRPKPNANCGSVVNTLSILAIYRNTNVALKLSVHTLIGRGHPCQGRAAPYHSQPFRNELQGWREGPVIKNTCCFVASAHAVFHSYL